MNHLPIPRAQHQSILLDGLPVSVNAMYRNVKGKGRVKSQRYNTWRNAVNWQLASQNPYKVHGDVEVLIFVKRPDKRRRDCDNLIKACLDLLVSNALIEDDSQVEKVSIEWTKNPDVKGTMIMWGPA